MTTFGCDPEFFLTIDDDIVVSPALLEKERVIEFVVDDIKHPVLINKKDFMFHMDGVAVELGLKRPCKDFKDMFNVVRDSIECLNDFSTGLDFLGNKLNVTIKPVVNIIPGMYLQYIKDPRVYQGFIFGCDPDEDLDVKGYKCKTLNVETHRFRYGGGHIHVGNQLFYELFNPSISLLSVFLGTFCVANSIFPELDRQRVSTYGKPRRYRLQKYPNGDRGVEYRSPSNSWTLFPLEKYLYMEELIKKVEYLLVKEDEGMKYLTNYLDLAKEIITTYNQEKAIKLQEELMK